MPCCHVLFMKKALVRAAAAAREGEVPVGAVLVDADNRILAETANAVIRTCDPGAHAEMRAIRAAAAGIGNYRLLNTRLYVTIEPCVMCMGAIIHARLGAVFYGAPDPKWGAAGSLYDFNADGLFNHRLEVHGGLCAAEAAGLMKAFFAARRRR